MVELKLLTIIRYTGLSSTSMLSRFNGFDGAC